MSYEEGRDLAQLNARRNVGPGADPARIRAWANYKNDSKYRRINQHWREGNEPTADDQARISTFDMFVLARDMQLYRGVRATSFQSQGRLGGKRRGDYIDDPAYVSTSFTRREAEYFADYDPEDRPIIERFIFDIQAPPGMAYSPIDDDETSATNEDEIVLPPGTRFLLTGNATIDRSGRTVYPVLPFPPGFDEIGAEDDPREVAIEAWGVWVESRKENP